MIRKNDKTVVLTGGHAGSTAYALVQEIKKRGHSWKIYFIGARSSVEGKKQQTYEEQVLPKLGIEFIPMVAGRIQRRFSIWTIPALLKIPLGFFHALYLLLKLKPDLVLSFGGFVGFPVTLVAKLLGRPVLIHDQTAVAGLSNRYASYFVDVVAISRASSSKYFPKSKIELTGNPVSKEVLSVKPKEKISSPPVILVTGGSRGSQTLNKNLKEILPALLEKYKVIHQTGGMDYPEFNKLKEDLSENQENYTVTPLIPPDVWKDILSTADVVVCRAGANTVSELMIAKIPCIVVPIPFIYLNEQVVNAKALSDFGLATVITETELTPKKLLSELERTVMNWDNIKAAVKDKNSPDLFASEKLADLMERFMV